MASNRLSFNSGYALTVVSKIEGAAGESSFRVSIPNTTANLFSSQHINNDEGFDNGTDFKGQRFWRRTYW